MHSNVMGSVGFHFRDIREPGGPRFLKNLRTVYRIHVGTVGRESDAFILAIIPKT